MLLEIASKKDVRFNIITFDEELIKTLESNVVLKKIVDDLGDLTYVGRYSRGNIFYSRAISSFWLFKTAIRISIKREVLIHFGMLNKYPLRVLYLINKRRTYICDKKAWFKLLNEKYNFSRNKIIEKCTDVAAYSSINFSHNSIRLFSRNV